MKITAKNCRWDWTNWQNSWLLFFTIAV